MSVPRRKKTPFVSLLAGLAVVFALPWTSSAQSYSVDAFPMPSGGTNFGIAADAAGSIWYTSHSRHVVGHVSPTGRITEYPIPTPAEALSGIVIGPDDNIWFGIWSNFGPAPLNRIGRISKTGTDFREFPAGSGNPRYLIVGPDGNIWFTNGSGLGRITLAGDVTLFTPSTPTACFTDTYGLTIGPDGALWMAVTVSEGPARFDVTTEAFTVMSLWECGTTSTGITTGPDGNLWLTDFHRGHLYRVTPTGVLTTFDLPGAPFGIASVGGDLFVTRSGPTSHIARVDPVTGLVLDEYPTVTPFSLPHNIAVDPSGNIWFAEQDGKTISRLSQQPLRCINALALTYRNETLTMRFGLKTESPALWGAWLLSSQGVVPLWLAPIPRVSPEVIFNVPLPGFAPSGPVAVLTTLINSNFEVCGDARVIDTAPPK